MTPNQRILSVGERIMYVHKEQAINCLFAVQIRGSIKTEQLVTALEKIQRKHPLLRSIIKEVDGECLFVLQEDIPAIPVTIYERQSEQDWKKVMREHWQIHIDVRNGPLAKVLWLKGQDHSELILVCPHCITDGVSITSLLRELLLALDGRTDDLEHPQAFMDKIDHTYTWSLAKEVTTRLKGFLGACLIQLFLPRRLKQDKVIDLGNTYMLHHRFSASETQALLDSCKKNGVSLYALMSTFFLVEFKNVIGSQAKGKLICPVDIRKFLSTLKKDHLFAFAPIIDVKQRNNRALGIWDKAKKIKEQMKTKLVNIDIDGIIYMNERFLPFVPKLLNHLMTTEGSHDFTFSNMGNLDLPQTFHTFSLEAVYSPTVAFPWRNPNTLVMSSYNGVLDLTFTSNNSVLKEQDARLFIHRSVEQIEHLTTGEISLMMNKN